MSSVYECAVEQVFHFADGKTVFAILPLTIFPPRFAGPAEVVIPGQEIIIIRIGGEFSMTPRATANQRAVFTENRLDRQLFANLDRKPHLRWA
jgi:hypothetical protein